MSGRRRYEDDSRAPVRGLREDVDDEFLRDATRYTPRERARLVAGKDRAPHQLRKIENYSTDPADWLADLTMTQTETALRLGRALIASGVAQSKVVVTLAGHELTHREKPRFPVDRFLTEWLGFTRQSMRADSWTGAYRLAGERHPLVLLDRDRFDGHLTTRLARQRRLVAFVSRGQTASTESSAEHKWLRGAIARAATWEAKPLDVLAVCVPRSAQFLRVARDFRDREGMKRLRLWLLLVDRQSGDVAGLSDLGSASHP